MFYGYKCDCGNEFRSFNTVDFRNTAECPQCGTTAIRDMETEIKLSNSFKLVTEKERWSVSMGVPPSQVEEFRKRFPNSVYSSDGKLLIKSRRDKLRQMNERGFVELDVYKE